MEEEEEVSSQTQEKRASHLKCQSILIVGFLIWQPQNVMNISSCPPCVTRCRCLPALSGPPRVWAWHLTSEGPGRPGQCRSNSGVTSHLSDADKGGVTSGVQCPVSGVWCPVCGVWWNTIAWPENTRIRINLCFGFPSVLNWSPDPGH